MFEVFKQLKVSMTQKEVSELIKQIDASGERSISFEKILLNRQFFFGYLLKGLLKRDKISKKRI